ncbi:DNA gyrase inhibitor YacG [Pseudoroseomonas cervicalis]|uniref:DNA gyrase inhibitor YacG n=1 Tax=Teichococcus cervicalis TaxID=204525 RepID=UPI0035ED2824
MPPDSPASPPAARPPARSAASPPRRRTALLSDRCRQVDLGRWLSGAYAIPAGPAEPEEEAEGDPPGRF